MKRLRAPLVIGNWKMNPQTLRAARTLATGVVAVKRQARTQSDVMVAPPFPFIGEVVAKVGKAGVGVVAQDMSPEPMGAFTGSVSASMLKSVGVVAVIVGHSERRKAGMTNVAVQAVVDAVLKARLTPIVCVGETERDTHGHFFDVVETQLTTALKNVVKSKLADVVIAYEPVWAIGTGKTALPEDVEEMKLFIQKVLITTYGRALAPKVRILYGGSVNAKNVEELWQKASVDGFLVGGASLDVKEFATIIKTTNQHVTN